jgi:DNA repair protein RecO (recombination protein O)
MSEKVEGIVLDALRFKENSVIAKIYTDSYGLLTILLNGLGAKKTKLSLAYLQPLTCVEFQLYFKDNRGVNKATDLLVINSPLGLTNNVAKCSIAVFIAEIILKTTKDQLKDYKVFSLLVEIANVLSSESHRISSLHLYFVIKYMEVLGFKLNVDQTNEYFKNESHITTKLDFLSKHKQFSHLEMTKNEKKIMLNYLLISLRSNLGMFDIQSYKILEEVMS